MGMERTYNRVLVSFGSLKKGCPISDFNHENSDWPDPNMDKSRRYLVCTYSVLLAKLLGQAGAHNTAALAGGGLEVSLAGLAPRRGEGCKNPSALGIGETRDSVKDGEQVHTFVENSHLDGAS
jgi:hypothetical protein